MNMTIRLRTNRKSLRRTLAGLLLIGVLGPASAQTSPSQSDSKAADEPKLPENVTARPLRPATTGGETMFTRLSPAETGVDFENRLNFDHPWRILYVHGFAGGGIAIGDFDGDDAPDVYLTGQTHENRLYRQASPWKFEDVTAKAGVAGGDAWGAGAAFADVDNDGDLDLYVCNYNSPNRLYVNKGDGTFEERAKAAGVDFAGASIAPVFADYDRDGDLDMYLLTNRIYAEVGESEMPPIVKINGVVTVDPRYAETHAVQKRVVGGFEQYFVVQAGQRDRLYQNNGDGTFKDVSIPAGIKGNHPGLSATWWDYNNDGWLDLYVGNDYWSPDRLYRNNGDGTFTDVIESVTHHTTWFSMGGDAGDINNDGLIDFLITDMSSTTHYMAKITMGDMADSRWFLENAVPRQAMRNVMYLNSGVDRLQDVAFLTGLASSDWSWSVRFADFDNDGWQDVFVSNGTANQSFDADFAIETQKLSDRLTEQGVTDPAERDRAQWEIFLRQEPRFETNLAFRNDGNLHFDKVAREWGLDEKGISHAAACADMDRDGDLDLIVGNLNEPVAVYRNDSKSGRRLLLRLDDERGNRWGIGAKVTIETAGGKQVRQPTLSGGYYSTSEPLIHFGLGDDRKIERMTIEWASGGRRVIEDLPVDRYLTIRHADEHSGHQAPAQATFNKATEYVDAAAELHLEGIRHEETPFDDYVRQPLLPAKMSQLGPGLAWGDANGDGMDDLYLGGAAGKPGQLLVQSRSGHFRAVKSGPWNDDSASEDMGIAWFDADNDRDLDLYVVSGGNEFKPDAAALMDRLYLNDGQGNFTKAPPTAIHASADSGGPVAAADFDRDGDVDLFVGGRQIPGQYPLPANSRLLRNDGGTFTDVTDEVAPGLQTSGMVTSALWSDFDGDEKLDLIIAIEWGPIAFWRNTGGKLEDATAATGLADLTGWWNSITGADFNGDGRIDYVALNAGLNTKYKASHDKPALLFYGDFEGNGRMSLVEAKTSADVLPVRGRSCSSNAMPFLKDKFPTYRSFASATLDEIYTPECLRKSYEFKATTLESGVYMNEGDGRFTFEPFPRIAQAAPGYGAVAGDFDGDARCDVYFVQNFFTREPETGFWDGGLSLMLRGDGDGGFTPVSPVESGLIIDGDAKGLALTDIRGAGLPTFAIAQNDGPLRVLRGRRRLVSVRLEGRDGAPPPIGARVTLRSDGQPNQTQELYAGSGYLSQSSPVLFFGAADGATAYFHVKWPDGTETLHHTNAHRRRSVTLSPDRAGDLGEFSKKLGP